jgi:hypothetical protein
MSHITHTRNNTHPYEYMHIYPTPMSTFETLSHLDLEIHKVDQRASRYQRRHRLPLKE